MPFKPEEVLFSPTTDCNLSCEHCNVQPSRPRLSSRTAIRFLDGCRAAGVRRVGFTGGEPFLAPDFLCEVTKAAVDKEFLFDRVMTNGVWWRRTKELVEALTRLRDAGYDGSICVSVDAFHKQEIRRVARFIRAAIELWRRPEVVTLARVFGAYDRRTMKMLGELARTLKARLGRSMAGGYYIKSGELFIKIYSLELVPVGKAAGLKNPWNGKWFKDDYCRGPGNCFLVMPDGDVKPCCGYASDSAALTIGNIRRDSANAILRKLRKNRFASTVFDSGLGAVRKRLEKSGVRFPGKTTDRCSFCYHILNDLPGGVLEKCLDR